MASPRPVGEAHAHVDRCGWSPVASRPGKLGEAPPAVRPAFSRCRTGFFVNSPDLALRLRHPRSSRTAGGHVCLLRSRLRAAAPFRLHPALPASSRRPLSRARLRGSRLKLREHQVLDIRVPLPWTVAVCLADHRRSVRTARRPRPASARARRSAGQLERVVEVYFGPTSPLPRGRRRARPGVPRDQLNRFCGRRRIPALAKYLLVELPGSPRPRSASTSSISSRGRRGPLTLPTALNPPSSSPWRRLAALPPEMSARRQERAPWKRLRIGSTKTPVPIGSGGPRGHVSQLTRHGHGSPPEPGLSQGGRRTVFLSTDGCHVVASHTHSSRRLGVARQAPYSPAASPTSCMRTSCARSPSSLTPSSLYRRGRSALTAAPPVLGDQRLLVPRRGVGTSSADSVPPSATPWPDHPGFSGGQEPPLCHGGRLAVPSGRIQVFSSRAYSRAARICRPGRPCLSTSTARPRSRAGESTRGSGEPVHLPLEGLFAARTARRTPPEDNFTILPTGALTTHERLVRGSVRRLPS